jgi:hypothetical protein
MYIDMDEQVAMHNCTLQRTEKMYNKLFTTVTKAVHKHGWGLRGLGMVVLVLFD